MLDKQKLIHNMNVRKDSLQHLIDRDITGNTLAVLEAWREVKHWKEAIERGEYEQNSDPLAKKQELLKKFKEKKRPDKVMTVEDLGLTFQPNTFDYFRELEDYKEDSNWLLKIRDELSDIEFPAGVLEYSIASPEGVYLMVKELKEMFLKGGNKDGKFQG